MTKGQIGFLVDLYRCTGCNACEIACRDRHDVQEGRGWLVIGDFEGVSAGKPYLYHLPFTCFHCVEPPCAVACPEGAIAKREEDGIVLVDEERCTGCLVCVDACPFDALRIDSDKGVVRKCDHCVEDMGDAGPACVLACPFGALQAGALAELDKQEGVCTSVRGFPDAARAGPAVRFLPVDAAVVGDRDRRSVRS